MMLAPEIALLASATALLLTLLNCLLVISARRGYAQQLAEIRIEMDANLSASHSLARHVRALQKGDAPAQRARDEGNDREERYDARHPSNRHLESVEKPLRDLMDEPSKTNTMSLAEKLGLSQSEAEIITHLRPRHKQKNRVSESV
tara:strand:- start:44127 stop:44564 length:438 start_codon:yes stop_codon:yes gene_type:complete